MKFLIANEFLCKASIALKQMFCLYFALTLFLISYSTWAGSIWKYQRSEEDAVRSSSKGVLTTSVTEGVTYVTIRQFC